MSEKKILYVEDDLSLIEGLKYSLEKNGFLVDNARTERRRINSSRQADMTFYCWMSRCRMGQALIFVKKYGRLLLSRLFT